MAIDDKSSGDFYDALADDYDRMIPFGKRMASARATIRKLLDEGGAASGLDVATGTGLHAMAMAAEGVAATGVDLSPGMVEQARLRAREHDLHVEWRVAPMERLASHLNGPFELLLCLGNSLPHLLERADLEATIEGFAKLLAPGGRLVLQLINYQRVLTQGDRIVAVTRDDDIEFVRFYDFLDDHVRFNILRIQWSAEGQPLHDLQSTLLHPWQQKELTACLADHGFHDIRATADFGSTPYDPLESNAIVLRASR